MNDITLIKLGGSLLDDAPRRAAALREIVARWNAGQDVVLVHGGGKHIDAMLARLGIARRSHAGLRITDEATLEVVVSVLAGTVNKMLVSELATLGVRAAGLSGADGATLAATRHPHVGGVDLGHVGQVTHANVTLIRALLTYGALPVVSPIAQGPEGLLNVNADSAAAALAVALRARSLRFLTDVAGVLDAHGQLVPRLGITETRTFIEAVSGGMKPKLQAALTALVSGVGEIVIGEEGGTTLVAA